MNDRIIFKIDSKSNHCFVFTAADAFSDFGFTLNYKDSKISEDGELEEIIGYIDGNIYDTTNYLDICHSGPYGVKMEYRQYIGTFLFDGLYLYKESYIDDDCNFNIIPGRRVYRFQKFKKSSDKKLSDYQKIDEINAILRTMINWIP